MDTPSRGKNVLVTGAGGYIGRLVTRALLDNGDVECVLATDVQSQPAELAGEKLDYRVMDIRDSSLAQVIKEREIDTVVQQFGGHHPGKGFGKLQGLVQLSE